MPKKLRFLASVTLSAFLFLVSLYMLVGLLEQIAPRLYFEVLPGIFVFLMSLLFSAKLAWWLTGLFFQKGQNNKGIFYGYLIFFGAIVVSFFIFPLRGLGYIQPVNNPWVPPSHVNLKVTREQYMFDRNNQGADPATPITADFKPEGVTSLAPFAAVSNDKVVIFDYARGRQVTLEIKKVQKVKHLVFSPVDKSILYYLTTVGSPARFDFLYKFNLDTLVNEKLLGISREHLQPAATFLASRDGKKLIFASRYGLFTLNTDRHFTKDEWFTPGGDDYVFTVNRNMPFFGQWAGKWADASVYLEGLNDDGNLLASVPAVDGIHYDSYIIRGALSKEMADERKVVALQDLTVFSLGKRTLAFEKKTPTAGDTYRIYELDNNTGRRKITLVSLDVASGTSLRFAPSPLGEVLIQEIVSFPGDKKDRFHLLNPGKGQLEELPEASVFQSLYDLPVRDVWIFTTKNILVESSNADGGSSFLLLSEESGKVTVTELFIEPSDIFVSW